MSNIVIVVSDVDLSLGILVQNVFLIFCFQGSIDSRDWNFIFNRSLVLTACRHLKLVIGQVVSGSSPSHDIEYELCLRE